MYGGQNFYIRGFAHLFYYRQVIINFDFPAVYNNFLDKRMSLCLRAGQDH